MGRLKGDVTSSYPSLTYIPLPPLHHALSHALVARAAAEGPPARAAAAGGVSGTGSKQDTERGEWIIALWKV